MPLGTSADRLISPLSEVESKISELQRGLQQEAKPRVDDVSKDEPGRDVSHHGRPIWNVFESSMQGLDSTQGLVKQEQVTLDALIADLKRFEDYRETVGSRLSDVIIRGSLSPKLLETCHTPNRFYPYS